MNLLNTAPIRPVLAWESHLSARHRIQKCVMYAHGSPTSAVHASAHLQLCEIIPRTESLRLSTGAGKNTLRANNGTLSPHVNNVTADLDQSNVRTQCSPAHPLHVAR